MTLIPGQKQLRGKTVKTRHGMQYKKGFSYAQQRQRREENRRRGKENKIDKAREKQVRKRVKDKRENRKLRNEK